MTTITTWTLMVIMATYYGHSGFTVTGIESQEQCKEIAKIVWKNANPDDLAKCIPVKEYVK